MEVERASLRGPAAEPGDFTDTLFWRAGRDGVESVGSIRGKLCTGAEVRRDATEDVETGIRLDVEDGGGFVMASLILAGVFSPDLTVVLPLASDAIEDARGFVGLRKSLDFKDFLDCAVERDIRVEDSEGPVEDLAGILATKQEWGV